MPRMPRVVIPGIPHHITQRGNNRQDVFFVDDDRRYFLSLLEKHCAQWGVLIDVYALMTNHFHLVAVPEAEDSFEYAIGRTNQLYAEYINRLHGRTGRLWQARYNSNPMDERHTLFAMRYVERNPVRARMVARAEDYPWSSAAAHCGGRDPSGLLDLAAWRQRFAPEEWSKMLRAPDDPEIAATFRKHAFTGRPLASDKATAKFEIMVGRRLRPLKGGRPRNKPE